MNAPVRRPAGAPSAAEVEAHAARHPVAPSTEEGPRGGFWMVSATNAAGEPDHVVMEVYVDDGVAWWMHTSLNGGGNCGRVDEFEADHRRASGVTWRPLTRDGDPAVAVD